MRRMLMLAVVFLAMAGCPEAPRPPAPTPTPTPPPNFNEELLRREKERRMEIEISRDQEKASREHWQMLTTVAILAAGLLLVIGIILGSRTRHDARRQ